MKHLKSFKVFLESKEQGSIYLEDDIGFSVKDLQKRKKKLPDPYIQNLGYFFGATVRKMNEEAKYKDEAKWKLLSSNEFILVSGFGTTVQIVM